MFIFDPTKLVAIIFLTSFVPGIVIAYPLLRREKLHPLELCLYGFALGFVLLPALLFFEYVFLGILYSPTLVYANIALLVIAGIIWTWRDGGFSLPGFEPIRFDFDGLWELARVHGPAIAIFIIVLLSFWMRTQSYTPIYAELDPYFYIYGGKQILTEGAVPQIDDTAWYPYANSTHKHPQLVNYNEALWYSIYTSGGEYYNYLYSAASSFYPPVAGALMVFFIYVLVSVEYGRKIGLVAASVASLMPITLLKFAAGVSEIQPYNFFALFFVFGTYAYALARPFDLRRMALVCIATLAMVFGSNISTIFILVMPAFVALQSLFLIYTGKKKELWDFFVLNLAISVTLVLAMVIFMFYQLGGFHIPVEQLAVLGATLVFAGFPHYFDKVKDEKVRMQILAGVAVLAIVALVATPVPEKFISAAKGAASSVIYSAPLFRTVAEQGGAGSSFQGEAGFLSMDLDSGLGKTLGAVPTAAVNLMLQGVDTVLNTAFGLNTQTGVKNNSIGMVVLFGAVVAAVLALARTLGAKHHKGLAMAGTFMLLFLLIFPVSYIGLNRGKFTIYYAVMLALAFAFMLGEAGVWLSYAVRYLARHVKGIAHNRELALATAAWLVFFIGAVSVYAEATSAFASEGEKYPIGEALLKSGMKVRYQDSPAKLAPSMAQYCSQLQASGRYDEGLCKAGEKDAQWLSSIDNQFSSQLCIVSLVTNPFGGSPSPSIYEQIGASYRCSRLGDYWINSMEWISNNTGESDKITSWWDYGHWINFFGNRDAVIRNEHASQKMIGMVAEAFIDGTPEKLAEYMRQFNSRYVLLDGELVDAGNGAFGGKFGALNYLSCAYMNKTTVALAPGQSQCEAEHLWENIYVPTSESAQQCAISESQGIGGVVGYVESYDSRGGSLAQKYCVGPASYADGRRVAAPYFLDRKTAEGELVLNKAILVGPISTTQGFSVFTAYYTRDRIWRGPNGTAVDGWGDRQGRFYDSNLYQGYYLKELPGFRLVYASPNGERVKIYELLDFTTRQTHEPGRTG